MNVTIGKGSRRLHTSPGDTPTDTFFLTIVYMYRSDRAGPARIGGFGEGNALAIPLTI
jgi:hypothetical protein